MVKHAPLIELYVVIRRIFSVEMPYALMEVI